MGNNVDMNVPCVNWMGCCLFMVCLFVLFAIYSFITCSGNKCTDGIGSLDFGNLLFVATFWLQNNHI